MHTPAKEEEVEVIGYHFNLFLFGHKPYEIATTIPFFLTIHGCHSAFLLHHEVLYAHCHQ
ncbi:hypothetical protein KSD_73040 [Ktedonobacter sp. SOSP1-85]|nr:hypothetical protein KSD_73040 [Ktedonobacter sp. SOSP1-85]